MKKRRRLNTLSTGNDMSLISNWDLVNYYTLDQEVRKGEMEELDCNSQLYNL